MDEVLTPDSSRFWPADEYEVGTSPKSFDKQYCGQIAANIRAKRPPEPYHGKGIKYSDERIRRKAGKTGK